MNRRRLNNEKGQAMVEFAVVLPLLVVLLFGIMQFGILFNNYLELTDATRAGGRKATVSRLAADPVGETKSAVMDAAPGLDLDPSDIEVVSTWQPASEVTVRVKHPYAISLIGKVVKSGFLTSEIKERVE